MPFDFNNLQRRISGMLSDGAKNEASARKDRENVGKLSQLSRMIRDAVPEGDNRDAMLIALENELTRLTS